MYEHTAEVVYDLLNTARGKDYAGEAAAVVELIRDVRPDAASVLDVGCGTGRHLAELVRLGSTGVGADVSPQMLEQARGRLGSSVRLELADVRTLALGEAFDAVVCLNGTIGYMTTPEDLGLAIARLADHLAPGGVLALEPWYAPDQWLAPMVTAESAEDGDVAVARVSRAVQEGPLGVFEWRCSVATPERTWSFTEVHRLGLHELDAYLSACRAAGLVAEHRPFSPGRGVGMIVAHRPG